MLDATDFQELRCIVNGYACLYGGHTPCASCLKALCSFGSMFPLISVNVGFADWGTKTEQPNTNSYSAAISACE